MPSNFPSLQHLAYFTEATSVFDAATATVRKRRSHNIQLTMPSTAPRAAERAFAVFDILDVWTQCARIARDTQAVHPYLRAAKAVSTAFKTTIDVSFELHYRLAMVSIHRFSSRYEKPSNNIGLPRLLVILRWHLEPVTGFFRWINIGKSEVCADESAGSLKVTKSAEELVTNEQARQDAGVS